jgi:D-alanyl-lipoteichoic acid acyltransferase DltB (MBOAT superfamily)
MIFNSISFAIFLPIVFALYWFVLKGKIKGQNILLIIASYFFYGWWDWRFLALIFFSSISDFLISKWIPMDSKTVMNSFTKKSKYLK